MAASIKGLTGGSDLKALVARAEGLPVGRHARKAAVTTAPSLSSGVTGLFRDLVSQPFPAPAPDKPPAQNPWLRADIGDRRPGGRFGGNCRGLPLDACHAQQNQSPRRRRRSCCAGRPRTVREPRCRSITSRSPFPRRAR